MRHRFGHKRKNRAVIMLLVLWILIILSLMVYSLLFQVTTETTITSQRKKQLQAQALARAGIGKAIVDLRNDSIFDSVNVEEGLVFDAEGDVWARPEEDKMEISLGDRDFDGYFNVQVFDEEALINLNSITSSNMGIVKAIVEYVGFNEEDAEFIAHQVVDYRDVDNQPSLPRSPSTDEGRAYAVLINEDEGGETDPEEVVPVQFRNEAFITVEELLELHGVTPDLFFGPGTPEAEYYNQRIPQPQSGRFQIENRRRQSRDEPVVGLRDFFTVYGAGTLNLNTAPHHVLAAFAMAAGNTDGDAWADRVIRARRGGKRDNIDNSSAFKSQTELMANGEIQGVLSTGRALLGVGVTSTTFTIVSEGIVGEARSRMRVVVARQIVTLNRVEDFEYIDQARERRDRNSGRMARRESEDNEMQVYYPYVRILQAYVD